MCAKNNYAESFKIESKFLLKIICICNNTQISSGSNPGLLRGIKVTYIH